MAKSRLRRFLNASGNRSRQPTDSSPVAERLHGVTTQEPSPTTPDNGWSYHLRCRCGWVAHGLATSNVWAQFIDHCVERELAERQRRAGEVAEIMVPGHGIWTRKALQRLFDSAEILSVNRAAAVLMHLNEERRVDG